MGANDDHVSAEYEVPEVTLKLWELEKRLEKIQEFAQAWEQGKITTERFAEATYGLLNENSPKADGHPLKGSRKTTT